ncbi:MAG: RNA polymerase sigma factor [Acidimicrobiia bacterium]
MDSATDAEVIARSLEEPEAFSVIFQRHHDRIFRYIARRVGADRAADLTSEVFLRAFKLRRRYDTSRGSCQPWLYGIATNVVGDDLRRSRRQQRIYLVAGRLEPQPDDPYQKADDQLTAAAVSGELNRALGSLRTGDRNVFLLYGVESLTYQETADALGIPIGTVRSRMARARRIIRELIPDLEQRTSRDSGTQL